MENSLLIVTHVVHHNFNNRIYASIPYVVDVLLWSKKFSKVYIAAPCIYKANVSGEMELKDINLEIINLPEIKHATIKQSLSSLVLVLKVIFKIKLASKNVDFIQIRCPGNIGFLGLVTLFFAKAKKIVKYAGLWDSYPGEPISYKIQKKIIQSKFWNGRGLIYGNWPNQSSRLISTYSTIFTEGIVERARKICVKKRIELPLKIIYTGRLDYLKKVNNIIEVAYELKKAGFNYEVVIIGDGPERQNLSELVDYYKLEEQIKFTGFLPLASVLDYYEVSDVLILASQSEGWGKSLIEGMVFGLVCIGSNRGLFPWMLDCDRGIMVEPDDTNMLFEAISDIMNRPDFYSEKIKDSSLWAQQFTLEKLSEQIQKIIWE